MTTTPAVPFAATVEQGSQQAIVRVGARTIAGVEFVRVTLENTWNGERETIYATEDGYVVSPMFGGYGDPTRWAVQQWVPAEGFPQEQGANMARYRQDLYNQGSHHASRQIPGVVNLTQAADLITRLRTDFAPDPEEEETPRCIGCGERPWGYGYCGEECEECAHEADRAERED